MMKPLMVLSLIVLPLVAGGAIDGDWTPIKVYPNVLEVAQFAVEEHNRQSKADLKLDHVVSAQARVSSSLYKIIIAASDGKSYEAIVWNKPWEYFRKLISFRTSN